MDTYSRSVCKKVPLKNILYFGKYKKDKFLTKTIFVRNLSFLYFPNHKVFFSGLFFVYAPHADILLYI
jgi:hypothetical protein